MVWSYVILAYTTLFALGLADNLRGPLFPEILNAFSLSDTRGSWMFALSSSFGILGGLSSRRLLLRWDRVQALNIALLFLAIGLAGMGLAPGFGWLLVASAFFGYALGLMGIIQNVLATLSAPPLLRPRVLAGLHSMYGLSSFLAPIIVALTASAFGTWRAPLLVASAVPFALMLGNVLMGAREHEHLKHQGSHRDSSSGAPDRLSQAWLGASLALYVLVEILVASRLALFMRREHGADLGASSAMVTWFFLCLLAGRLLCSVVKWPGSLRAQLLTSLSLSIACMIAGISGWAWAFVLCGLTMAPFYPIAVAYLADEFPRHLDSAMGIAITLQSALVVLMHLSVGILTDLYGLRIALSVGPVALGLGVVLLLTYGRRKARA